MTRGILHLRTNQSPRGHNAGEKLAKGACTKPRTRSTSTRVNAATALRGLRLPNTGASRAPLPLTKLMQMAAIITSRTL
eukprot:10122227-Lingulodinium_polyedra.AAC.1